jgi:hypothetical protein
MRTIKYRFYAAVLLVAFSLNAAAVSIEITQSSLFLSVSPTTYQDDELGYYDPVFAPKTNTFAGGFDVSYSDNLDANNLGEMTWLITNNTGGTVSGARFMGFLDAEIGINQYWDEYGALVGDVANTYDSWEIDEPGYSFGDIYDNLQAGGLDNSNGVPASSAVDVSLALGFDIGDWMAGETIIARFLISGTSPAGAALAQHDAVTGDVFYFSGSVGLVPIPGSGGLMLSGLVLLAVARYRGKYRVAS